MGQEGARTYVVQIGDTPMTIARAWTGNPYAYGELVDANPAKPRSGSTFLSLVPNERLLLPFAWQWRGLGASDDCGGLAGSPEFLSAQSDLANQIKSEGGTQTEIDVAKATFCTSAGNLAVQAGVTPEDAIHAAAKYTAVTKTIAGVASHVEGLMQAAQSGPSSQVVSQMAGLVVTVAVAAGASAGIGAAVMLGAALVGKLLDEIGVFGNLKGVDVGGGVHCDPPPTFVVNHSCFWDPIVHDPSSPNWRKFPSTASINSGEPWPGFLASPEYSTETGRARLIDRMFPQFHQLECEQTVGYALDGVRLQDVGLAKGAAIYDFLASYFGAWKANKEYTLNGLQAAEDWQVLLSTVWAWNRLHEPGDGYDFTPVNKSEMLNANEACRSGMKPYVSMLIEDVLNSSESSKAPGGKIHIYTGPPKTIPIDKPRLLRLGLIHFDPAPTKSTATKVVAGTLGTAAVGTLGLWLYSKAVNTTVSEILKRAANAVRGKR